MKTIWKFELQTRNSQVVQMPVGAKILHVNCQRDRLVMWALVDDDVDLEGRMFAIFGTGHMFPSDEGLHYLGTSCMFDGDPVWHVFEIEQGEKQ